ncbi:MAG TPA: family 43 glycosylhydrolase [Armatimonadota bacterium]|jgi:hypothetical protein
MDRTYCNPLPLPNYQLGRACLSPTYSGPDYREMADPTVIRFKERWYLFPSAGMLWYSDDLLHWTYHPIEPFDAGYAPTVVQCGDVLYLTASWDCAAIWRATDPLGPWERLGTPGQDADGNPTWLKNHLGQPVRWGDPMLFVDDDGALYCYCNLDRPTTSPDHPWKLEPAHGIIYGVRLGDDDPSAFAEAPLPLIAFDPSHTWERFGEFNQHVTFPVLEGPWLNKIDGRYYLQYSGCGTQFKNYALGSYVADAPLGPFRYQQRNPILIQRGGLVNGTAHHSIVEGTGGQLWCFYTTLVGIHAGVERRIGMDPAGLDANGELYVAGPTETPQYAPGVRPDPLHDNDLGLLPISVNCPVCASSQVHGCPPRFAVDNEIRTGWQAAGADTPQWLEIDLQGEFRIHAARTIFADEGLDHRAGVLPGPYRYRILATRDGESWEVLCDQSANMVDRNIAYDTWPATTARRVRLEVLAAPPGMAIAVLEFTVFGEAQ